MPKRPAWQHDRPSRHDRGYDAQWVKTRARILKAEPLCRSCASTGRPTVATEVDHILPKSKGGTDDEDNLAPICHPCHAAKTALENGRTVKPKTRYDASGRPIW